MENKLILNITQYVYMYCTIHTEKDRFETLVGGEKLLDSFSISSGGKKKK